MRSTAKPAPRENDTVPVPPRGLPIWRPLPETEVNSVSATISPSSICTDAPLVVLKRTVKRWKPFGARPASIVREAVLAPFGTLTRIRCDELSFTSIVIPPLALLPMHQRTAGPPLPAVTFSTEP